MRRRRYRRNPLAGPGSSKTDNTVMWGALILGGVAAAAGIGYLATRPAAAAAAAPTKVRCPDGTMQTDCTGHGLPNQIPAPSILCPDGTVQSSCVGHMTPPVVTWTALDFAAPGTQIQSGKTYRGSFTGSVGGPEMTVLGALLQQTGLLVWTQGPADWPSAVDAADPSRVKFETVAAVTAAAPLALIPTLKMWVKS